jgi:hypothetical protein
MIPEPEFSHGIGKNAARQQVSEEGTLKAAGLSEATILERGKNYFHTCMGFISTAANIYILLWAMTPLGHAVA